MRDGHRQLGSSRWRRGYRQPHPPLRLLGAWTESDGLVALCNREGLLHLGGRSPVVVSRLVRIDHTGANRNKGDDARADRAHRRSARIDG